MGQFTFSELAELMVSELASLKRITSSLVNLMERLLDENRAIKTIHSDLMNILQQIFLVQSDLPDLVNGLVSLATETKALTSDTFGPLGELKEKQLELERKIDTIMETLKRIEGKV